MFERFTEEARHVVVLAQDEARALLHDWIGTEHLLLGLLRQENGIAAQALAKLGISLDEARESVARVVGETAGEPVTGQIPFTPRAKRVLELSLREALSLGDNFIGTEHLLLGLIREDDGLAASLLIELGTDLDAVRTEIVRSLSGPARGRRQRGELARLRRPASSPRWEYRVERPGSPDALTAEWLDAIGAQGWELVGFEPGSGNLVFKRRAAAAAAPPRGVEPRFERFTERARQAVVVAQEETRRLGHDRIGTEHLLLGLIGEREGLAARVLTSLGVTLDGTRAQVAPVVVRVSEPVAGRLPFTPRAEQVLGGALVEAHGLGHNYVGTEHVLLRLVRESEGGAARVLLALELEAEKVREDTLSRFVRPPR